MIYSETSFYKEVGRKKVNGTDAVVMHINGDPANETFLGADYVDKYCKSADTVITTEKVTQTELSEKFLSCKNIALTVNFYKKIDEKVSASTILDIVTNTAPAKLKTAITKEIKTIHQGEERTMVGYHEGVANAAGRVQFCDMKIDLDTSKTYDNRLRQVDPRTINWVVVDGVKYVKK